MNIHHLELFYYVARHGGITAAVRKMPYGIQQPAISAQILQLEETLGLVLFDRRPFRLTRAGEALYAFITPFFGGLDDLAQQLQGGEQTHLAIGAQELILRDYLPPILRAIRAQIPKFTFTLHALGVAEIDDRLREQQIDLGLLPVSDRPSEGIRQRIVVDLPPCLLVREDHPLRQAATLWRKKEIDDALVALPIQSPLTAAFQKTLRKRRIEWPPSLELPSLDLIARYVVDGYGIGLSVVLPHTNQAPAGTRSIPLPGFSGLSVGARWLGAGSPLLHRFVEATITFARGGMSV